MIKLDMEGHEKAVFTALQSQIRQDRPVIPFELVGQECKGGFVSEKELGDTLYENHLLFGLDGRRGSRLSPLIWSEHEEAVCLPAEGAHEFAEMMR